jgi:superfamily II DNA or RNA helicase
MASPDFVKQAHVLESVPVRPWDLLVVDEAHDACGESSRHEACHELARRSRRVLLLTATPHSGDPARFARLQRLGELPGLSEPLTVFRRTRAGLGMATARRVRWHRVRPSVAESRLLAALLDFERRVLRTTDARVQHNASLLLSVFRKRLLSTPAALRRSLDRRRQWLSNSGPWPDADWMQPALDFAEGEDDVSADEVRGLAGATGLPTGQERSWLRRLSELAGVAEQDDTKARRVVRLLSRTTEPTIVFTEFRDSLSVLDRRLRGVRSTAILHGGLTETERRQALDRFASGAASVLLATDVASQGLNLQERARWVLSLELPWNPVRLEQRAGRVDRIGQRRPVHVTLLVTEHPAEQGLLYRLARRVLVARRAVGEDTLRAGLPDEAGVRHSLLTGAPEDLVAVEPGPPICRRWVRPGHWMANRLRRWRRLRTRWRTPHVTTSTAFRSQWRPGHAVDECLRSCLLIFGVPIVDEHGALIEDHVAFVRAAEGPNAGNMAEVVEGARDLVTRLVGPRVARLKRLARAEARRAARVESAIARRLTNHLDPGEVQSGLFDRRSDRLAEAADADAFEVRATARERLAVLERRAAVDAGRPVLRAILGRRP